jgi:hypothetical protein
MLFVIEKKVANDKFSSNESSIVWSSIIKSIILQTL